MVTVDGERRRDARSSAEKARQVAVRSYEEKLERAGLTSLKERRVRGDLIEAFKTLRGINNVNRHEWFDISSEVTRPTRANTVVVDGGETQRIDTKPANSEVLRNNFYTVRVARAWNKLP